MSKEFVNLFEDESLTAAYFKEFGKLKGAKSSTKRAMTSTETVISFNYQGKRYEVENLILEPTPVRKQPEYVVTVHAGSTTIANKGFGGHIKPAIIRSPHEAAQYAKKIVDEINREDLEQATFEF